MYNQPELRELTKHSYDSMASILKKALRHNLPSLDLGPKSLSGTTPERCNLVSDVPYSAIIKQCAKALARPV